MCESEPTRRLQRARDTCRARDIFDERAIGQCRQMLETGLVAGRPHRRRVPGVQGSLSPTPIAVSSSPPAIHDHVSNHVECCKVDGHGPGASISTIRNRLMVCARVAAHCHHDAETYSCPPPRLLLLLADCCNPSMTRVSCSERLPSWDSALWCAPAAAAGHSLCRTWSQMTTYLVPIKMPGQQAETGPQSSSNTCVQPSFHFKVPRSHPFSLGPNTAPFTSESIAA